ncbi:MAG TPA: hypothetical protein DDW52_22145 [Planctomycetaceae bacterium]|nr:hypothetical protein [Planctomycetaceae bacterium]
MPFIKWLIGGAIGAVVGGLVWVLLGYYANIEVGYVAWGIGILVGLGVRFAAHLDSIEESEFQGVVAAAIALLAVITSKFVVFYLLVSGPMSSILDEAAESSSIDDGTVMTMLADNVVEELEERGRTIRWPAGQNKETAVGEADYPPAVWKEASKRFENLTEADREDMLAERQQSLEELRSLLEAEMPTFTDTFSPMDALWIFLAVASAYKLASGGSDQ